ncbi:MAG: YibE/F family protein [Peptococcaceae bacterium]|nr:YibE/F family protein [Peptococcaceae bacterium]
MRYVLVVLLFVLGLILCSVAWVQTEPSASYDQGEFLKARVLEVVKSTSSSQGDITEFIQDTQQVTVEILDEPFKGDVLTVTHANTGHLAYDIVLEKGDKVLLWGEIEGNTLVNAYITDYVRDDYLIYLVIAFVLMLVLLGGLRGIKSVISLGITGAAIAFVLLPMLLKGFSPIPTTVLVSAAVSTVTFVIIGGPTKKTLAAIIGTTGGVVVAGVLALLVGNAAHLTGFSEEEAMMLMYIPQNISFDFKGLLFAGIIIGALGAVMDVGMSIASAMDEIKKVNPSLGLLRLIGAGMNVGRDIMGTMANTLILAYTGAAIPLMLLFMAYETPLVKVINLDMIATEVVRAMAGSIGLIVAIPITAVVAGFLLKAPYNH